MKAGAVNAVIERAEGAGMTFGDLVASVSEVADKDALELLTALFASGRARFVDPGALDRLGRLSCPLPPVRRAARAPKARLRSASARRASRAN